MAPLQGECHYRIKKDRALVSALSLPKNPAVISHGESDAKDKNIVSGRSGQHGHLAGV
jgi:hypothetical protein